MNESGKEYHIVYSSDITIEDAHDLSALCIFYDRVVLPHVVDPTVDSVSVDLSDTHQTFKALLKLSKGHFPPGGASWVDARTWDKSHRALFDEGVIVRLDDPPSDIGTYDEDLFFDMDAEEQFLALTRMKNWDVEGIAGDAWLTIRPDMVRHLCRGDLDLPELHVCGRQPASREIIKFLEAKSVFSYRLPKLGKLNAERILQVRERVKETREGFSLHLQKLSEGVEQRLRGGDSITEIEHLAKSVVETELSPDYGEFRRQLSAERRGHWKTVLDAAGKILSIDANPLTPKFWGQILAVLGVPLNTAERRKEELSNRRQAFQFMKSVERSSVE